ncbi:MAG: YidC/Oxa1 family insertase periplasmic-domain containing protein [Planctomycetaceae bacterium]|nr:YidC/Oxa1 family insertase periplasmic-domain containing protein [Planctomycetaceae bacterium]
MPHPFIPPTPNWKHRFLHMKSSLENPNDRYAASQRQMIMLVVTISIALLVMSLINSPKKEAAKPDLLAGNQKAEISLDEAGNVKVETETGTTLKTEQEKPSESSDTELVSVSSHPPAYATLGSADPDSPYKMLVTFSSRGAVVTRVDLNKRQFRDTQDFSGWLGQIVVDLAGIPKDAADGCPVQVVGAGTPAEAAGLKPGDRIIRFQQKDQQAEIATFQDLREALLRTRPRQTCSLTVRRGDQTLELSVKLGQAPLGILRPEMPVTNFQDYRSLQGLYSFDHEMQAPLSFQMTLARIDDKKLADPVSLSERPARSGNDTPRDLTIDRELEGLRLRSENWELESATAEQVVFKQFVTRGRLLVRKIYRLEPLNAEKIADGDPGYALTLKIEIQNTDTNPHTIAYLLDGPTGLPIGGAWYSTGRKSGPGWGGYGLRDLVVRFSGEASDVRRCTEIARDNGPDATRWRGRLDYLGVDTQYFQCTVLPQQAAEQSILEHSVPIRVGTFVKLWPGITNISFRLVSAAQTLEPQQILSHEYQIFAGPKQAEILAWYGLHDTLYYGWFAWFVKPLLWLLHFFHSFLYNYVLAILMLTAVVRLCLYRLSRKQILSTMKMQELKPEMEAINAKHPTDMQARSQAMQALYRKHKFNPLSGCLPVMIQIPILFALYKALSIDVELYGASFLGDGIRWCSDLAAPDRLWDWSDFWTRMGWDNFNTGQGTFYLGPYFNVLPIITVALMLVQQTVMMPPATTDQEKSMRSMMKYMMAFMAFMFYKFPSGLCIYWIITTIWGLAEKKFMPKPQLKTTHDGRTIPAEVTVTEEKHVVKPVVTSVEKQKKKKQPPLVNEDEPAGFWHHVKKRWREVLEQAEHRPGDSQKPGKRTRKK